MDGRIKVQRREWAQGLTAEWQNMRSLGSQAAFSPQPRGTHASPISYRPFFCRMSVEHCRLLPPAMKTVPSQ